MMSNVWMMTGVLGLLMSPGLRAEVELGGRVIPHPLTSHPGNVFLAGEEVVVESLARNGHTWRVVDYEGRTVAEGRCDEDGRGRLGKLGVGYYELLGGTGGASNRVSLGVLEPLRAPTPLTSPIGVDVAMAWFFPKERMAAPANLCALAGMNRVRDRLLWPELEPKRGEFVANTRYDASLQAQVAAGLQVLQVAHASPAWANPNQKRFPPDLRDIYHFYREMARRWHGQILAFEPWNEADIAVFGGHTGSEMASLQKAAYLGLKAGNPKVIACLNVFAIHRAATLRDFDANEAWAYFDTFNLHHYEPLQEYPQVYADFRAVCAGRPLWVSECSVRVKWEGDEQLKELSAENLRLQSERVTKTFALALHQGAQAVFYFMLPHYTEGKVQFGLLHADLTPRPGFLALAAVGRLLADAKPLGRLPLPDKAGQAYFFDAKPDGRAADVMVVWAQRETAFELPQPPQACFDHLGRSQPVQGRSLKASPTPLYAVLAKEGRPTLVPPPKPAEWLKGEPGPIVLQALLPEEDVVVEQSAYKLAPGQDKTIRLFGYNFGEREAQGRLTVSGPEGWKPSLPATAEIMPGERRELALELAGGMPAGSNEGVIRIAGDFGPGAKPVLSLRFVREAAKQKAD